MHEVGQVITMAAFMQVGRQRKVYAERRICRAEKFKALYRFKEDNVERMAEYFLVDTGEKRGGALSIKQQMQIFLRYLADPGFQIGVGEDLGVQQTTVCKTFSKVLRKVIEKANEWIEFPVSDRKKETAKEQWQERYLIPFVIGAIDCTHVRILKPGDHGDEYINRKGVASINVQATCDASEKFTSVDATWPGSVHDSRIWKNSDAGAHMVNTPCDAILLGDEGYGIAPWLMTPFSNPTAPEEISFNRIFTRERVI